jgi:hypothetical protein
VYVPSTVSQLLVSTEDVAEVYGQAVRFVGFADRGRIYADTSDGSASLIIEALSELNVYWLPETHSYLRLRAFADDGYLLACGYQRCGLFEPTSPSGGQLAPIPGSEFSGGLRFDALARLDVRLCVSGPDTDALCFDGENWTDEAGEPKDPEALPGSDPPAGHDPAHPPPPLDPLAGEEPAQCPPDSEVDQPLIASRIWFEDILQAATSSGRIVFGQWDPIAETPVSCSYVSAELGTAVDFDHFPCGLSSNARLLTATQAFGEQDCVAGGE